MQRSAVADTSPFVFLARTSMLDLLREAFAQVVLPGAVVTEIRARVGREDEAVAALTAAGWLRVADPPAMPHSIALWDLGAGESATIALASTLHGCVAVIDDRQRRACAAAHGVPCIGTLGLVLAAKRRGQIAAVRPRLDALLRVGFYVSPSVLDAVAREAGE